MHVPSLLVWNKLVSSIRYKLLCSYHKSVCTSEESDQSPSFQSHFLPMDRPSKSDQTAWMGTHVNLYLLLDKGLKIKVGF